MFRQYTLPIRFLPVYLTSIFIFVNRIVTSVFHFASIFAVVIIRRIIVVFVLLVHINGSMLMPQVAETDVYDASGRQIDDINTVVEYIDEVVLGNKDTTPEDEDNDDGQNFHVVKTCDYYFEIPTFQIKKKPSDSSKKQLFGQVKPQRIESPLLEVIAPPPKA